MDPSFERIDSRVTSYVDWIDYHERYFMMWENRYLHIINDDDSEEDENHVLRRQYM